MQLKVMFMLDLKSNDLSTSVWGATRQLWDLPRAPLVSSIREGDRTHMAVWFLLALAL